MNLGVRFREAILGIPGGGVLVEEFDALASTLTSLLGREHKPSGGHGAVTADSLVVDGDSMLASVMLTGALGFTRAAKVNDTLTATVTNYNPTGNDIACLFRLDTTGAVSIRGWVNPHPDEWTVKVIFNASANTITFEHNDAAADVLNRFACPGSVDYALASTHCVAWVYDTHAGNWRILWSSQ